MNDYPKVIEIQFHNICNANCTICPYASMGYKADKMSDDLFEKFVSELDDSKLTRVIPYLNNEPFLDKDYAYKVAKIREKCPNVEIEISTNLSAVTEPVLREIAKQNITELRMSVFGFSDTLYKKMMPGLNREVAFEKLKLVKDVFKDTKTFVSIVMIDTFDIDETEFNNMKKYATELGFNFERWGFLDRAKNVKGRSNNFYKDNVCGCEQFRPVERMHILCNGDVIFCCQDWSHDYIVGNIATNTIQEVWLSQKYQDLRDQLYNKDKVAPMLCRNCKLSTL